MITLFVYLSLSAWASSPPHLAQPQMAHAEGTAPQPDAERPSFLEFAQKWHFRLSSESHSYGFDMGGGSALSFVPNVNQLTMVGVSYADLAGTSIGFRQGLTAEDRDKGSTRYQDWRFNFAYRAFNIYLAYSRYAGFYLDNTNALTPAPTTGRYLLFPHLKAQNIAAHFTYVLNQKRFSLAAMMDQTERQIRSGGSWLAGLSATQTVFQNSDGPFIPTSVRSSYGTDGEMSEGRMLSLSFRFGGGYSLVFGGKNKKWFLSGLMSAGIGPQQVRISTPAEDYVTYKFLLNQYDIYISSGWNGDRYYAGWFVHSSQAFFKSERASFDSRLQNGGIFVGTRL